MQDHKKVLGNILLDKVLGEMMVLVAVVMKLMLALMVLLALMMKLVKLT